MSHQCGDEHLFLYGASRCACGALANDPNDFTAARLPADRPTLARVPRYGYEQLEGITRADVDADPNRQFIDAAAYDTLAQQLQQANERAADYLEEGRRMALQVEELQEQLQQAQADRDRWALNYNMAQADLARARWVYEADILRLTAERDDLREQLQQLRADVAEVTGTQAQQCGDALARVVAERDRAIEIGERLATDADQRLNHLERVADDLKEQLAGALETIRNFAVDAGARED